MADEHTGGFLIQEKPEDKALVSAPKQGGAVFELKVDELNEELEGPDETRERASKKLPFLESKRASEEVLDSLEDVEIKTPKSRPLHDPKVGFWGVFWSKSIPKEGRSVSYSWHEMLKRAVDHGRYMGQQAAHALNNRPKKREPDKDPDFSYLDGMAEKGERKSGWVTPVALLEAPTRNYAIHKSPEAKRVRLLKMEVGGRSGVPDGVKRHTFRPDTMIPTPKPAVKRDPEAVADAISKLKLLSEAGSKAASRKAEVVPLKESVFKGATFSATDNMSKKFAEAPKLSSAPQDRIDLINRKAAEFVSKRNAVKATFKNRDDVQR